MDIKCTTDIGEIQLILYVNPQGDVTLPLGISGNETEIAIFLRPDNKALQAENIINVEVDTVKFPDWIKHIGKVGIWCSIEGEIVTNMPIIKLIEKTTEVSKYDENDNELYFDE